MTVVSLQRHLQLDCDVDGIAVSTRTPIFFLSNGTYFFFLRLSLFRIMHQKLHSCMTGFQLSSVEPKEQMRGRLSATDRDTWFCLCQSLTPTVFWHEEFNTILVFHVWQCSDCVSVIFNRHGWAEAGHRRRPDFWPPAVHLRGCTVRTASRTETASLRSPRR